MRETVVEKHCVKVARLRGGRLLKWTSPGTIGVPDRILLLPGCPVVFVELKNPTNSTTAAAQKYWRDELREKGFIVWSPIKDSGRFTRLVEELIRACAK